MAVTYYQRSAASDLTGAITPHLTSRQALRTNGTGGAAISTGNLNSGVTTNIYFFTDTADPGTDGTSTGNFTVLVRITTGNTNLTVRAFLARNNPGSDVAPAEGAATCSAGTKTFTWSSPALGTWVAGDRLRVRLLFTNTSGSMNQSCEMSVETVDDTVVTPFTAAPTNAPAESASATGTSNAATVSFVEQDTWTNADTWANATSWPTGGGTSANAGSAAGTGTANNATVTTSGAATAGVATGTSAAQGITAKISPTPTTATATGTADNATIQTSGGTNANAQAATAAGVADNATTKIATTPPDFYSEIYGDVYGSPLGIGAAQNATAKVSPTADAATGTGVANNATVQTGSFTNAQAGVATGTGTANSPGGAVILGAQVATGTGTANNAVAGASVTAQAGVATGTGTANGATVTVIKFANAENAAGVGTVNAVSLSVRATAEAATALGQAFNINTPEPDPNPLHFVYQTPSGRHTYQAQSHFVYQVPQSRHIYSQGGP